MKKIISLLIGLVTMGIVIAVAFSTNDYGLIWKLSGIIALISIGASGIFLGAFVNGNQQRGNYFSETEEHRENRTKLSFQFLMFGIPHIIAVALYFML
ncbi:DUF5316 domain-containing protein [Bacillus spizizenii]|nr:DUF5316 domain-containing protein [Bacillus spizizenii]MCY8890321.1 DUF5316 domain-containing protein [Bacillus spizizenii]MEC0842045.1 DUF5316 domain-containing protein [Bacillus spizizenii]